MCRSKPRPARERLVPALRVHGVVAIGNQQLFDFAQLGEPFFNHCICLFPLDKLPIGHARLTIATPVGRKIAAQTLAVFQRCLPAALLLGFLQCVALGLHLRFNGLLGLRQFFSLAQLRNALRQQLLGFHELILFL